MIGHVAIIMDGNGRWATRRGRPRWMGHVQGAQTVRRVVSHCATRGVQQLTLYAFSSDNWKRPADEVRVLMELFTTQIHRQVESLVQHDIRLSVIGRRARLPHELAAAITMAERRTHDGRRMHVRVAVDYSSRAAIATAHMDGAASLIPDVDLLIRTGGERRLSDFVLWESAYAELAFLDVAFPDLTSAHLDEVFTDFTSRERRFGGLLVTQETA
jgi:undecaprenyl diphosphate synthase